MKLINRMTKKTIYSKAFSDEQSLIKYAKQEESGNEWKCAKDQKATKRGGESCNTYPTPIPSPSVHFKFICNRVLK